MVFKMNQKNDNLKSNKSVSSNSNRNSKDIQSHRNDLKVKIMDKYGLSSNEADKILLEFEKKFKKKKTGENHEKEPFNDDDISDLDSDKNSKSEQVSKSSSDINTVSKHVFDNSSKMASEEFNKSKNNHNISKKNKNVDSILEDIIPDYNQQISIKLDHVDLTFEVQSEKTDTLKEAFIRTLKRDKSKKIKIHALKDISFQIYKGEKVGIIGYNGAGKSTLLNVISGIYPPDKGNVFVYGKISPLLSLGAGFDHNSSGRKNILLNGAVLGYDKEYLESKIDEIIEFSELGEFIDIPIKNYSSGMLAKLGFSIATAVNPDILIIDEIL